MHARLSPSSASRWLRCTAAPSMEARYPAVTTSYAEEGTFAHKLAELCTQNTLGWIKPTEFKKQLKELQENPLYSSEMLEHCEEYAQYVLSKYMELKDQCKDAFVELEVKLDLQEYIPESFGTADCVIIAEPLIQIIDFKYGKGVQVEAMRNVQMEIYALGAISKYERLYDFKKVGLSIVQPRLGGISEAQVDRDALRAWAISSLKPQAKAAFNGPGVFVHSESACRFCRAKADCKARADHFLKVFEDHPIEEVLTSEDAGKILTLAEGIEAWLKDLTEKVTNDLMQGRMVPGWKLVAGRSNRKITCSDEELEQILREQGKLKKKDIYTQKIIPLTQIEKLLGAKKAAEVLQGKIVKPEGAPTLAKASDTRPEIFPAAKVINAFDE